MKKVFDYVWRYVTPVLLLIYLIIMREWVGALGWFGVFISELRINQYKKYSTFLSDEVDMWYKKYYDYRYGKKE